MSTFSYHRKALSRILGPVSLLIALIGAYPAGANSTGISSQTTTIETVSNASGIEIDDDFQVSGYSEEANLLVSLSVTGNTQATLSLSVSDGLTREYGYNSWTNVSTLAFTGTQSDTNTALASLTLSAGSTIGTATLNVSVQEKIAGANYFDGTGNFYEFVPGSITYLNARTAAGQRTLNGLTGYLVTITSEEEHNYVLTKIPDAYNIWIGLSDRAVEGTWVLDPKDGHPEQGTPVWSGLSNGSSIDGRYAKWCGGEPNDSGNEDAAVTKWNGGNCWNDLPATGYSGGIGGYVVEYEPTQGDNPIYTDSLEINIQAPYLNVVTNLTAVANADGSVDLDWDEPTASNVDIYAYSVSFYDLDEIGGTTSGGWGVWTNQGTNYSLGEWMFSGSNPVTTGFGPVRFGIKAGNQSCFSNEGVGPCVYGPEVTVDATVIDPASSNTTVPPSTTVPVTQPPVTTAPEPEPEPVTTTTVYVQTGTTTTVPEEEEESTPTTFPDDDEEPSTETTTVVTPQEEDEEAETETTPEALPDDELDEQEEPSQPEEQLPEEEIEEEALFNDTEELIEIIKGDSTAEEISDAVSNLIADLDDEEVLAVVAELLSVIAGNKDITELTDEDKAQIAAVVTSVIQNGVTQEVAVGLASNAAVLESIDASQAEAVFGQVSAESLTAEQAEAVVGAVQSAPEAIREVFEDVVDLFQGAFDGYKMLGQTIDVGQRRTVVAASLLVASAAALGANGPTSPSSGGSSPAAKQDTATRRKEEEESESAGEIAGDGLDWIKRISIYKYVNGEKFMDWKSFFKKFAYGIFNMGFTIAGSLVVYLTLSGPIQRIAGISTVLAIVAAMWLHMKEPDSE
jgi:hypothetical protein